MKDDLVIVTKDRTFHDNFALLGEEYHERTGYRLLRVIERFTDALKEIGQAPPQQLIEAERKIPQLIWQTKGSGRHAAALWSKVDQLIGDYIDEVELDGEDIGGDQQIIPIMRLLASMITRRCDEVEADIQKDFGTDTST